MPKLLHSQKSFNGGAISPRLYGRTDLGIYQTGLKTAENIVLGTEGHMRKRNGTQYIAETGDSSTKSRLIPFQYSQTQSVVLEFGNETIRFFADKAQIKSGGTPYEIVSPYTESDLPNITYAQFANVLYIACEGYAPRKLTRESELVWTLAKIPGTDLFPPETGMTFNLPGSLTLTSGNPAKEGTSVSYTYTGPIPSFSPRHIGMELVLTGENSGRAVLVSSALAGITVTILSAFSISGTLGPEDYEIQGTAFYSGGSSGATPSATTGSITISGMNTTDTSDVGKTMVINGGQATITSIYSTAVLNANVISPLTSTNKDPGAYFLGNTGDSSSGNPKTVGMYDQRLVFANTLNNPQSVWLSQFQDFSDFTVGISANDGMRVDVVFGEYSAIGWLSSSNDLLVGGARSESSIKGNNGVLTPTNADSIRRSSVGSKLQVPVQVENETLFISNTNRVYSIRYSFDVNNYVPQDLSQYAEHLTNDALVEMAYAQRPDKTIHVVTEAGDLLIGTFSRAEQVIGWSKYITDGSYESVASIREAGVDQVWVVVNRTIGGTTARYIEVFDQGNGLSGLDGFSDSYLTYSGVATNTLTGLDHLEGETVEVKIDNGTHSSQVVTSGSITLTTETTTATVGLPYTMTVETLPIEKQLLSDSIQGQQVSWVEPILRVYQSTYPTVNGQVKTIRQSDNSNTDEGPTLATGFVKYGNVDSSTLTITDTGPLPVFINSISGEVEVGV